MEVELDDLPSSQLAVPIYSTAQPRLEGPPLKSFCVCVKSIREVHVFLSHKKGLGLCY